MRDDDADSERQPKEQKNANSTRTGWRIAVICLNINIIVYIAFFLYLILGSHGMPEATSRGADVIMFGIPLSIISVFSSAIGILSIIMSSKLGLEFSNSKKTMIIFGLLATSIFPFVVVIFLNLLDKPAKPKVASQVTASFVINKLRYGYSKSAEREIWCFEWDSSYGENGLYKGLPGPITRYPNLLGSTTRYRTVAWEREAVGGDRILQTYDLTSNQMARVPLKLMPINGVSPTYEDNGWRFQDRLSQLTLMDNSEGAHSGGLDVRLEGGWRGSPINYFFGDVVVIMNGKELLRQRVDKVSAVDLTSKCQYFSDHDLFVYLDGPPNQSGTAWFLDLTRGQSRPILPPKDKVPRLDSVPQLFGVFIVDNGN